MSCAKLDSPPSGSRLPPKAPASVGYDVFDDYDIGSKNQKGAMQTRYGNREELIRCVAMMRANGLDV
jgi:alpha-amylase